MTTRLAHTLIAAAVAGAAGGVVSGPHSLRASNPCRSTAPERPLLFSRMAGEPGSDALASLPGDGTNGFFRVETDALVCAPRGSDRSPRRIAAAAQRRSSDARNPRMRRPLRQRRRGTHAHSFHQSHIGASLRHAHELAGTWLAPSTSPRSTPPSTRATAAPNRRPRRATAGSPRSRALRSRRAKLLRTRVPSAALAPAERTRRPRADTASRSTRCASGPGSSRSRRQRSRTRGRS